MQFRVLFLMIPLAFSTMGSVVYEVGRVGGRQTVLPQLGEAIDPS